VNTADVAVIGSGFGGLAAALAVAETGRRVVLFEAVNYPGGCAGSYTRRGARFDTGATLVTGLGPDQLFTRWLGQHGVTVPSTPLDPVLTQVIDGVAVRLPPSREGWCDEIVRALGVDASPIRRLLRLQERVAAPLFALFQRPERLPPLTVSSAVGHARRAAAFAPLAQVVGRTFGAVLDRCGVVDPRVRRLFDGLCQITVQVPADEADAIFAMGALEVFFAGATHVSGGLGGLADGLVTALRRAGGEVRFAHRVLKVTRDSDAWVVATSRGDWRAPQVVANVLPSSLTALTGVNTERLRGLTRRVAGSWGAAVVYAQLDPAACPPGAAHRQLVGRRPTDGDSVWVSVGDHLTASRHRTLVASTHLAATAPPDAVAATQRRILERLAADAPDLAGAVRETWTASPRTFERFTRRPGGA
jgi:phytoene dehydrogenase-like protein